MILQWSISIIISGSPSKYRQWVNGCNLLTYCHDYDHNLNFITFVLQLFYKKKRVNKCFLNLKNVTINGMHLVFIVVIGILMTMASAILIWYSYGVFIATNPKIAESNNGQTNGVEPPESKAEKIEPTDNVV